MVEEISGSEADELVGRVQGSMCPVQLARFREAFSAEYVKNPNRFEGLASNERRYYVVTHEAQREALFGIRFAATGHPCQANISSMSRIVKKSQGTAPGWWYLVRVIEEILIPRGVCTIDANLNQGSATAFAELRYRCSASWVVSVTRRHGRIEVRG